jgi:hypothetical protein
MSEAELRIAWRPDEDGIGQIIAIVKSGAFIAQGSAWFNPDQVKKTFVAGLRPFPLTSANPPTLADSFGSLDQGQLRITIQPYNSRGTLVVSGDLADDAAPQNRATIRFLTEYAAVGEFAEQLERVLDGESAEAVLNGITN